MPVFLSSSTLTLIRFGDGKDVRYVKHVQFNLSSLPKKTKMDEEDRDLTATCQSVNQLESSAFVDVNIHQKQQAKTDTAITDHLSPYTKNVISQAV